MKFQRWWGKGTLGHPSPSFHFISFYFTFATAQGKCLIPCQVFPCLFASCFILTPSVSGAFYLLLLDLVFCFVSLCLIGFSCVPHLLPLPLLSCVYTVGVSPYSLLCPPHCYVPLVYPEIAGIWISWPLQGDYKCCNLKWNFLGLFLCELMIIHFSLVPCIQVCKTSRHTVVQDKVHLYHVWPAKLTDVKTLNFLHLVSFRSSRLPLTYFPNSFSAMPHIYLDAFKG